ncbi:MAG: MgtC/SapB family protein [Victivallaceae bacterium]|nr:MgtC/SapB family protein [Victivallaceae bacterium]
MADWWFTGELLLRLVLAGILGGVIGFDREYRAKEAGVRTHFVVTMGSALMMIVSQYGFAGAISGCDASRVAAQIVSGIGFIGAGTIICQNRNVSGLTTAAAMWTCAGIGMAIGGGLYAVGIAATILTMFGLEVLHHHARRLAIAIRQARISFSVGNEEEFSEIMAAFKQASVSVLRSSTKDNGSELRARLLVRYNGKTLGEKELEEILGNATNVKIQKPKDEK